MRTLLASLIALAALIPAPTADACGGYVDQSPVLLVIEAPTVGRNSFVLLTPIARDEHSWTAIAPHFYDRTSTATMPDFTSDVTLTLVGASGAEVITTRHQTAVADSFAMSTPTTAIAVEKSKGTFAVAVVGNPQNATWTPLAKVKLTPDARAWVKQVKGQALGVYRDATGAYLVARTDVQLQKLRL